MSWKQSKFISDDFDRIYPLVASKLEGLRGQKLLVTGGAGFIGCWICELISYMNSAEKAGIKLYVVDRNRDIFADRLPHLVTDEAVEFIRCDVRSLVELPKDVNYVIHAAATPDNRFHASSPFETMTTIAEGTACLLRAVNRVSNLIRFVYVSASAIYSTEPQLERIPESAPGMALIAKPASAYAEAKRYAEMLCAAARSEARIPVVTVRPFTFCGAYQQLDSPWFLNNFINDALHQRPIRMLGDGRSVRSLMYGADLACWMLVIMLHANSGQAFNVGSDHGVSVGEMAMQVARRFSPMPAILANTSLTAMGENSRLVPDVTLAKTQFGLDVYSDVEQSISRTIDWYRSNQLEKGK